MLIHDTPTVCKDIAQKIYTVKAERANSDHTYTTVLTQPLKHQCSLKMLYISKSYTHAHTQRAEKHLKYTTKGTSPS